jgi:phosphoribosylformylglycinamidine cyclo-ligase
MRRITKIKYSQVGDNYATKDPIKKIAQVAALTTSDNLTKHGFFEVPDTRGESAYVWRQGNILMASVIEGLGTKNLVADEMRKITGRTYYDIIAHDTVATIINDLITVGATPLVVHAYWAIENNDWLKDIQRMKDFIRGWKNACNRVGVSWGGGETPTLKGIINKNTVDLGGSAVGIIKSSKSLIIDRNLKVGDRILLIKSNGINANGVSLARAVADKLPEGYATKITTDLSYGESLLARTNIYSGLVNQLLDDGIHIHYITNITGHGLRKIMRARQNFTYIIEKVFPAPEVFLFIQKHANLTDQDMYETYNMGQDYALFVPQKDIGKAQQIIAQMGFDSIDAGIVAEGKKQVIIRPCNIIYPAESLDLR